MTDHVEHPEARSIRDAVIHMGGFEARCALAYLSGHYGCLIELNVPSTPSERSAADEFFITLKNAVRCLPKPSQSAAPGDARARSTT